MTLLEFLTRFEHREETDDGFLVHCPAHTDSRASLRIAVSEAGKILLRCRAGCETPDVLKALKLSMRDLAAMEPGDVKIGRATSTDTPADTAAVAALAVRLDQWHEALRYEHESDPELEAGAARTMQYAVDRFGITVDDADRLGLGYVDDLGGGPRLVVPFRDLDGVARGYQARALEKDAAVRWLGPKAPDGASWAKVAWFPGSSGWDEILICEGPGDGLTGAALGYDAIGIAGAGQVSNAAVVDTIAAMIGDREAVIAGDGDPAGRRFSVTLARALADRDKRVRVLDVPEGKDLTSWREAAPDVFQREVIRAIMTAAPVKGRAVSMLAWDEERYSLTDLGGARFLRDFVESKGSGVRHCEEIGYFLLDDGVWRRDDRQAIRTHAQSVADFVKNLAAEAKTGAEQDGSTKDEKSRAGRLRAYARHAQTSRGLDAMLRELQAVEGVPASPDDFDKHPDLLAVRNGVVNLRTGELRPHDPELLMTRRVDLEYDPDATAPRWERFLGEVFPKYPALPAYMQRLIGYGITGSTAEQSFSVLWGTGANGKSVFTDTLTEVFRELTVTTPFSTFEERQSGGVPNDLAALKGARLVMAAEGEQGRPMAEAVLKRVTGRDLIAARFMRKEFFEFRPSFLLLLATNFRPQFRGQDEGLWRRVKLIPWEKYFAPSERDHRLGEQLLTEAPGILTWAIRGALEWYANGLQDPAVIKSSTREYRETSDALAGFLGEGGAFVHDADGITTGKILWDSYTQWADEEGLPLRERWTRKTFFAALEERECAKRKDSRGIVFVGIRRARQTDAVPDHTAPEPKEPRAVLPLQADSSPDKDTPTVAGPSLDDVF